MSDDSSQTERFYYSFQGSLPDEGQYETVYEPTSTEDIQNDVQEAYEKHNPELHPDYEVIKPRTLFGDPAAITKGLHIAEKGTIQDSRYQDKGYICVEAASPGEAEEKALELLEKHEAQRNEEFGRSSPPVTHLNASEAEIVKTPENVITR